MEVDELTRRFHVLGRFVQSVLVLKKEQQDA